jgi:FkbM family methyltransferase
MKRAIKQIINLLGYNIQKPFTKMHQKSILSNKLLYYKTKTGNYYLPEKAYGDNVANSIKTGEIYQILDIGSNYGQMSILFSNFLTSIDSKVYSFEANPFVFNILVKNIEINNKKNKIIPVQGAVWNNNKSDLHFQNVDFIEYQSYGSYGIDFSESSNTIVKSLTIDSLSINEEIGFIKIDIQGSDLEAMQGAIKLIKKNKCPILFEYEYLFEDKMNFNFQDYVNFINQIDYKFIRVIGNNYLIIPK